MNIAILQSTAKHFLSVNDTHRPAMHGVYFDVDAKKAVMTNGYSLLTVDIAPDPEAKSFIAPLQALPKKKPAEITFDGSVITTVEPKQAILSNEPIKEQYLLWQNVLPDMPDEREGITRIHFNPSLFAGFAAAVKNLGGSEIRLDFLAFNAGVKVTPANPAPWEGIVMPMYSNYR